MKKSLAPQVNKETLDRAVLTPSDYTSINARIKYSINRTKANRAVSGIPATAAQDLSSPPPSNTGGMTNKGNGVIELRLENNKPKIVVKRTHYDNGCAIVDWVNSVYHEVTFLDDRNSLDVDPKEVLFNVSFHCQQIFGFGITMKRNNGANFYQTSYDLGDAYGLVCYGGQKNTLLIMLNGSGCAAAKPAWESRLADFIDRSEQGRITRIDLAHDDFTGEKFNAEKCYEFFEAGWFQNGQIVPNIELRGNWLSPNGKGRTINIGSRSNGLLFRGYEKGKQLGDVESPWFRCEVEFGHKDRILPSDMLRFPSSYFTASFPAFSDMDSTPERIAVTRKTVEASYERTKRWLKKQAGSALNVMLQIEGSATTVLDMVSREGKIPKGLTPPSYEYPMQYLHQTNEEEEEES